MIALLSHEKLKKTLVERKIRQEPFAEMVGISERHVRNLCSRDTDVSVSLLYKISERLNIPMRELLVVKDENAVEEKLK